MSVQQFIQEHAALVFAFIGLSGFIVYTEIARLTRGFRVISPAQLTDLVNRENALVVDIRAKAEYDKGHIAGSVYLAPSQFDPENKMLAKVRSLPIVIVCRNGMTAAAPAKRLVKAGFSRVYVLDGGVAAWQHANMPLTRK